MIKHMPMFRRRFRHWGAAPALLLAMAAAGLSSGCGGSSSTSVISTGFPAGNGTNSLVVSNLTLTATNLPAPVSFPAPVALPNSDPRLQGIRTFSGTGAIVPGTAFLLRSRAADFQFPSAITMTIAYANAADVAPITLNIYYLDSAGVFQPVIPAAGGFASVGGAAAGTGSVTTTITGFQGQGVYAVLAGAPPANP